jgi:glycosyltransferase involved in cell wall biosynthesis
MSPASRHVLIYEPRTVGHHPIWLNYVTEDLLAGGFQLTLAVDRRPAPWRVLEEHLGPLLSQVKMVAVHLPSGVLKGDGKSGTVARCLEESGAGEVFLNCFDEIASHMLRWAALGRLPARLLQGRLSGVYLRPRHLEKTWNWNTLLKGVGFRRLLRRNWFRKLLLCDEYLHAQWQGRPDAACLGWLCDPWSGAFSHAPEECRARLGVPPERRVFLQYGTGSRRKGLHLVVEAMLAGPENPVDFLLCVGHQPEDREVRAGLGRLAAQGRAQCIDRYVSAAEEEWCFCAADLVLLPYLGHYGSSGVLSRAAAAGKPVITSDEGLLGRRVRDHQLGLLFRPGDAAELKVAMKTAAGLSAAAISGFRNAGLAYARTCSRDAFRRTLWAIWDEPGPSATRVP